MTFTSSNPEILYHYTTQKGLLGILESKVLWLTDLHYLNDQSEFVYPIYLAEKIIEDRTENIQKKYDKNVISRSLSEKEFSEVMNLEKCMRLLITRKDIPIYICSFSEAGDQLGQWRGYCNNESGYSIGFDYEKLNKLATEQNIDLKPCIYNKQKHLKEMETVVEELIKTDTLPEGIEKETQRIEALKSLWSMAPTIKHISFKEEMEWRLISKTFGIDEVLTFFRPGKSSIIPYIHFLLGVDLPIREIVIGPTPNVEIAANAISQVMLKNKLKRVKIKRSKVPYRTW
ncbi:MAG: hypothetical protein CVU62_08070 [Deltaproteobacteria bacterium HGW-Deltaproteobacteria-2]|jgi:hypothetical protein|nr:MAG: hypothetical protein CVU62_08070 [Deltaproteobacteria bacterium HGW-Deltaproteobacteria-2]